MYEILIQYFKGRGKYAYSGSFKTDEEWPDKVFDEVEKMRLEGRLPGLAPGAGKEFTIYVNCDSMPNGYPRLIQPIS